MLTPVQTAEFKVKIKSLADEARTIRKDEHKHRDPKNSRTRESLHNHRINVVRPESRATFLAYAYVRQIQYARLESGSKTPINYKNVQRILKSRAGLSVTIADITDWVSGQAARIPVTTEALQ